MSKGTCFPQLGGHLPSHRGLLILLGICALRGNVCAAMVPTTPGASAPLLRHELNLLELDSSGEFSAFSAEPTQAASGADASTSEEWPEAAVAKDEVSLGYLKGGTRPQKVKIGSNVFVRKKVLEGESQAIMMEALANELYKAAGVKSEHCRYYPGVAKDTKAYLLCRFIDGLNPVMDFTEEVRQAVSQNFVLDAAFANYDVGGTNGDNTHRYPRGNVGWDIDKNLVRVDNGGSLAADGLGDWKPTQYKCKDRIFSRMTTWSPEPFQLWDFQRTSEIYHHLSKDSIVAQVDAVVAKKKEILAAVDDFQNEAAAERVKATLEARLECLGRIAKKRSDLLDIKHMQAHGFDRELPSAVCDGVRQLCADLLVNKTHSSP